METTNIILLRLLKTLFTQHTITSLSKEIGLSRVGTWKALKKIEAEKLIHMTPVGKEKKSTYTLELNWTTPLTEKHLDLLLTEEAQKNKRWSDTFQQIAPSAKMVILFGSILHSPKEANDIDILIIADKKHLHTISEQVSRIQKTQIKKIHSNILTKEEFEEELLQKNKIFIDAIKKGVVLFGQQEFIKTIRRTV